jgi:hypothetical protein
MDFFVSFIRFIAIAFPPLSVQTLSIENYFTITIICLRIDYGCSICSYNKDIYKVITCSSDDGLVHWRGRNGGMAAAYTFPAYTGTRAGEYEMQCGPGARTGIACYIIQGIISP